MNNFFQPTASARAHSNEASDAFTNQDTASATEETVACDHAFPAQDLSFENRRSSPHRGRRKRNADPHRRKSALLQRAEKIVREYGVEGVLQNTQGDGPSRKTAECRTADSGGAESKHSGIVSSGEAPPERHDNALARSEAAAPKPSITSNESAAACPDKVQEPIAPPLNGAPAGPIPSPDLTIADCPERLALQSKRETRRRAAQDYVKATRGELLQKIGIHPALIEAMLDDGGMSPGRLLQEQAIIMGQLGLALMSNAMKQNSSQSAEVFLKYAEKFMRGSQNAIVQHSKMSGGVRQHVTVQHLNVNEGGSAMVAGQVSQRKGGSE